MGSRDIAAVYVYGAAGLAQHVARPQRLHTRHDHMMMCFSAQATPVLR